MESNQNHENKSSIVSSSEAHGNRNVPGAPSPPPLERPPFTLKEIRDSIPPHCFNRSLIKSFSHLFLNLLICAILFYAATYINCLPTFVAFFVWPVYWFVQGAYMTGILVIAHECAHEAFSDYKAVNDSVGLVLHSVVLVPYFSWKITHRKHHLNTGSCENDEVFVPSSRSSVESSVWAEILEESPIYNFGQILFMLIVGWMPGYLVFNASGPQKYKGKNANHFSPTSELFLKKQFKDIVISDIGIFTVLAGVVYGCFTFGFTDVLFYYGAPYFATNCHVVVITYLQHTDTFVPHFRESEWSWLRGALCTVDRSFGPWLDGAYNHISRTLMSATTCFLPCPSTMHKRPQLLSPKY